MAKQESTLLDHFYEWETALASRIWLTQPDGPRVDEITWAQAGDEARRMASHLRSLKLERGSRIGILSKNCAHWILADLAIWMAGHVSVPLYTSLQADTAAYVLEHADVALLFVGKLDAADWETIRDGIAPTLPCVTLPLGPETDAPRWHDIIAQRKPLQRPLRRKPTELATLIYTSGSTGRPKGVMISFGAMLRAANGMGRMIELRHEDRMLSYLPLAHTAERAVLESNALRFGFRLYFNDCLASFSTDMRRAKPTLFFAVPRIWSRFYQDVHRKVSPSRQRVVLNLPAVSGAVKKRLLRELGLEHVRVALSGAAALSPAVMNWFKRLELEVLEGYGMTENFAYSHFSRPGDVRGGSVGTSAPGVICKIAADGEVLVNSPCNMMGYHKQDAQANSPIDAEGFLHTGDRGEIDQHGHLRITGRIRDLFKTSKGKYVAPAPIEERLLDSPLIESACVCGQDFSQPYALLVLEAGQRRDAAREDVRRRIEAQLHDLMDQINARLEPHEFLSFFAVVDEPWRVENEMLTPTLKIRRERIESHYLSPARRWEALGRDVVWE
ncbi:MAG: AMP-binding protein [Panacagrimonas sp.]